MPSTGWQQCSDAGAEQCTQRRPDCQAPIVDIYDAAFARFIHGCPQAETHACSNGRTNERVSPPVLFAL
jgi:hypothetical protein